MRPLPVAVCAALLASSLAAQEEALDLAALEARGAIIGMVNIDIDNVFDTTQADEDKRLYRWANRVHRNTRPSVVEDILLFSSGEPISEQLIDETARLLRDRWFIADASVAPGRYDPAANTADVDVWLRDSWSLEPDIKLSRSGGENEYGLGLTEDNLFGLGKEFSIAWSSDIDRDERLFGYSDGNLFGSRKRLSTTIADMSDGRQFRFATGRPFYALDTRWSVWSELLDDERIESIYDLGETIDEFRHDTRFLSIQGGRSRGLVDGAARRWLAGISFEEDLFRPSPGFGPAQLLPANRKLVYPWAGFHWVGDDWRELSELNDMGRTEDISLGLDFFARIGVASPELDSDRRAILLDATAQRGWEPGGAGRLMLFEASAATRSESDGFHNTVVSFSGRYMRRNLGRQLFLASLSTVFASELDAENQILLGGDSNLRGYPLRYQSGERSAVLNIEQRFYTELYPFRLIRIGYAFFFDAGRVWGDDPRRTPNLGTLYDIGVGLRLTSPRSSGRSVVHVDLAFPLNAPADIDDVQIVIEKKATF